MNYFKSHRINLLRLIVLLIFFHTGQESSGQINTEKFRKHDSEKGFIFNVSSGISISRGNSEYTSVDGTLRVDYNQDHYSLFAVGSYDFKSGNSETLVHKGFGHLRGIVNLSSRLAAEMFLQQEFNEFLLLADRKVTGAGLRYRLIDLKPGKDTPEKEGALRSFAGSGIMYERELYRLNDSETNEIVQNPVRITSYLTLDWKINKQASMWAVAYYQPDISDFSNYRTMVEGGLEVAITKKLFLTTQVYYRFNRYPVGDVKPYDLIIKNGLRLRLP
ncbi:MAG: hypothetical protein Kow00127_15030 [Bacteroidales bacterium]